MEADGGTTLFVFSIVVAGMRYLISWLSRNISQGCCDQPGLLDYLAAPWSPQTRCLQYCRSVIVSHSCDRFICVFALSCFTGRRAFVVGGHPMLAFLHKAIFVSASCMWLRGRPLTAGYPWKFAQLGGDRFSEEQREGIVC